MLSEGFSQSQLWIDPSIANSQKPFVLSFSSRATISTQVDKIRPQNGRTPTSVKKKMLATIAAGDNPYLPPSHGACEPSTTPRVLTIISHVVERLVARNERLVEDGNANGWEQASGIKKSLCVFNGVRAPAISVPKYLERIRKYTDCSPSCFVVGYAYLDRLLHRHPHSLIVSRNVHRLLVTCVMVASKILDDEHHNNSFFARVGGVSNMELNRLEMELLFMLDFDVTVSYKVFEIYCLHLEKEMNCSGTMHTPVDRPLLTNGVCHATALSFEDQEDTCSSSL